jgi:hypothetical protein
MALSEVEKHEEEATLDDRDGAQSQDADLRGEQAATADRVLAPCRRGGALPGLLLLPTLPHHRVHSGPCNP